MDVVEAVARGLERVVEAVLEQAEVQQMRLHASSSARKMRPPAGGPQGHLHDARRPRHEALASAAAAPAEG
ncbi:MAG TPA: hypothetical protein VHF51_13100 [Solirubrobacteraceae bacterium]|nr:hypothetical protein [Solirubrobacteraceae bacterium]